MARTEERRDDPSGGKSGASPSAPGAGVKSHTVDADPDTRIPAAELPQASPVPDVVKTLKEDRSKQRDRH